MDTRPRIGVIGTGWWATQFHIPGLASYEGAELVALADPDEDRLAAAAAGYDVARFADAGDLCGSGLVDGVVIAVPHAHHHAVAKVALEAGVHVLLEKPMVLTAAHAWDLVDTAEARGLHLMVGYTYQFTRAAAVLHGILRSGRIGELVGVAGLFASMVESYYRGRPQDYAGVFGFPVTGPSPSTYSDPAISGGGQAQTQITHAMGMVLWATGLRVEQVSALMANRDLAVDLVDAISYRLEGGAIGTMAATGGLRPGQPQQQELRYYGTEGFVLQDLLGGTLEAHYDDGTSEAIEPLGADEVYPAQATARGLADLIAGRGANLAPGREAAHTVEFLEAAYASARNGAPVRVADLDGVRR